MFERVFPTQEETDFSDPEQHFLWALRNLPMIAGTGMVTLSGYLRGWSKHLWEVGCVHRDYLVSLADENGYIHVSQLPEQQIKFQEPFRGPHHQYNNAARWVRADEPDPEPVVIPNIQDLTLQERYVLAMQLKVDGVEIKEPPKPPTAEVVDEGVSMFEDDDTGSLDLDAIRELLADDEPT